MTGGKFWTKAPVYVGGPVYTNELACCKLANYPADAGATAIGHVRVAGGAAFTTTGNMFVGVGGTGTVEVVESGSTVSCQNLVLSNNVVSVLKFGSARLECGVFIGGGNLHDIIGNRFSDCKVGVRIDSRGRHWPNFKKISDQGLNWFEKWAYEHDWRRPPWSVRYPRYAEILADRPDIPHANKIVGNAFMDCKTVFDFKPSVIAMTNEMPVSCNKIIWTEKRGSAGNMIKCSTAEGQ